MSAARKLITFGPALAPCEPARRIVDPTPCEVLAFTRRPVARQNRGRIATSRVSSPLTIVTSVPIVEWWRADLGIASSGGFVDSWTGFYGNVLTGTLTARPAYSASDAAYNGRPSITADGVNDALNSALTMPQPGTSPRYFWFIFKAATAVAPAANGAICCGKTNQALHVLQLNSGVGADAGKHASYNGTALSTAIATPATVKLGEALFSNSVADRFSIGSTTVTGINTGNQQDATGWGLFSHGGADTFWAGSLSEFFITVGDPTASERARLGMYASLLYGGAVLT